MVFYKFADVDLCVRGLVGIMFVSVFADGGRCMRTRQGSVCVCVCVCGGGGGQTPPLDPDCLLLLLLLLCCLVACQRGW